MTPPTQEVIMNQSISLHTVDSRDVLRVVAWVDPVVDTHGHPVTDPYIEMFWLPVLGPTATWLYRRLVSVVLDDAVDFYDVDMADLARSIGVAHTPGRHNPFARALQRCTMFGVAQNVAVHPVPTISVRRCLPTLPQRHLQRLPDALQVAHHDWIHVPSTPRSPSR
jgi:hypothetical protein